MERHPRGVKLFLPEQFFLKPWVTKGLTLWKILRKGCLFSIVLSCCLCVGQEETKIASSVKKEKEFIVTPKATKIPPTFYDFKVIEAPKEEKPPLEFKPEPPPEPEYPPVAYKDPKPSLVEQQTRRQLAKRRAKQKPFPFKGAQGKEQQEVFYAKDPHYRQWDQHLLEDKFTYPVHRDWVLTADRLLSGVLETDINSQIPGTVVIVIDWPIFTAKGWKVLLPQYTKVICDYQPLSKVSDTRLSLKCRRAIRPDGASLLLTEAQGTDPMGRTGLVGDMDHRTFEKYGSAFTLSVMAALASSSSRISRSPALQESVPPLSQNLGQVTAQVLEQSIDLAPILTIEAGTRVHIRPSVDIWLRPPLNRKEWEERVVKADQQEKKE